MLLILTNEIPGIELEVLGKYYDVVRVIEPSTAAAVRTNGVSSAVGDHDRYSHFGENGEPCSQCICLQAVRSRETVAKVASVDGKMFLITAMPVEVEGRTVALELVKCIAAATLNNVLILPTENTQLCPSTTNLTDLVFRDALTNLYNRRYIDKQLIEEMIRHRQNAQSFSVVMVDIDNFKQINDRHGHPVGDEVLKTFAEQIHHNIRENSGDWGARYGGEEFLLLLANCSENQAYKVAEKLRKMIASTVFPTTAGDILITASFGVYTSRGQETEIAQLIDKVDTCLYQAKRAGRNCTAAEFER